MKKIIYLVSFLILCLSVSACGSKFSAEKAALVGSKWFSGEETYNSIVVWNFYDESVEQAKYFVDGNGIHDSEKKVAEYTMQKDAIKIVFDNEELLIPYTFENDKIILKKGEFFTPEDIEREIQGFWTLHKKDYIAAVSMSTENEYNIQFDNGIMRNESAAKAYRGAPGEYYYYGPDEGEYTIGDGKFETETKHGNEYFFNVYGGKVNILHYGDEMKRAERLPGQDGYKFN